MDNISHVTAAMMRNMRIISLLLFALAILPVISACNGENTAEVGTNAQGSEFLSAFYLVTNGREFPSAATIDVCRVKTDDPCHKTLLRVETARERLLSMPHNEALALVLEQITRYCTPSGISSHDGETKCSGAFSAIYYFNSAQDDKRITHVLASVEHGTLQRLLNNRRSWVFNRRDITSWEQFAEKNLDGVWRDMFLEDLRNQNPDDFGMQLLDK